MVNQRATTVGDGGSRISGIETVTEQLLAELLLELRAIRIGIEMLVEEQEQEVVDLRQFAAEEGE